MKDKPELSRRTLLGRFLSSAALVGLMTLPARAINRFTKGASRYMNHPNGDRRCAGCMHFRPPGSCEVVMGRISPHGWCKWWRPGHGGMKY
jgi:hypothetical protein